MDINQRFEQIISQTYINYFVMFKNKEIYEPSFSPVLKLRADEIPDLIGQSYHLFDPELNGIIPALRYILHLPRIGFDTIDISTEMALNSYDCPHDIIIFPSSAAALLSKKSRLGYSLLIYDDACDFEAQYFDKNKLLDIIPISQLSSKTLLKHWNVIGNLMKPIEKEECIPKHLELLRSEKILAIPQLFLLNHMVRSNQIFELETKGLELFKELKRLCFNTHCDIAMINEIIKNPDTDQKTISQKVITETKIPVVITMMGRPIYQKKFVGELPAIPQIEREVCRIMGVHRASARDGVVVELNDSPKELYILLNQLEQHCKSFKVNNSFVWATLKKIGKIFTDHINVEQGLCMVRASHITAFTDFPIGLAVMPNGSAPLCCYTAISYRPITPLTRALQLECQKTPQHYIGKHCKIVIAECLSVDDKIRTASESTWCSFEKNSKHQRGLSVVLKDVKTVDELKQLLCDNNDADILLISAHGAYEREANIAGLCIGKDIWLGNDNDMKMPPLVMLSACHVSPRGSGSVNVADLLLRVGAKAVLGTFIPVDVRRNAILYIRFLSYIQEALNGNKSYKTVLDAWTGVAANNAVNDIICSSEKLTHWYMTPRKNGKIPLRDFMLHRSVGRLHGANIYDDTIKILQEMTTEDGLGEYFDSIINSQGYFPESLFYQMIGSPENIFLYNSVYDQL
jgi:hypothetical protein